MEISEPKQFTEKQFQQIKQLMEVLDNSIPFHKEQLEDIIRDNNSHLFVLKDGEDIIGCCTVCVFHSPTGRKASIEDVVVSPSFQGRHLGRRLMDYALSWLRGQAPVHIQLTSRPVRTAANALYASLGFLRKETNVYTLRIE